VLRFLIARDYYGIFLHGLGIRYIESYKYLDMSLSSSICTVCEMLMVIGFCDENMRYKYIDFYMHVEHIIHGACN